MNFENNYDNYKLINATHGRGKMEDLLIIDL